MCLIVLTDYDHDNLNRIFKHFEIPKRNYKLLTVKQHQVRNFLMLGDYGLWPSKILNKNNHVEKMHSTVIGIKTCEYLAAGLPLIANDNMEALKNMIEENDLGFTFSLSNIAKMYYDFNDVEKRYCKIKRKCIEFAYLIFNIQDHAAKYVRIYESLIATSQNKNGNSKY